MSILEKEFFEECMTRIMERFDSNDRAFKVLLSKESRLVDGELIMDNQDVCQLLQISKRTLQRHRSSKQLPFHRINNKTYYKESDVKKFIKDHFDEIKKKVD